MGRCVRKRPFKNRFLEGPETACRKEQHFEHSTEGRALFPHHMRLQGVEPEKLDPGCAADCGWNVRDFKIR